jgi:hypothetical protein
MVEDILVWPEEEATGYSETSVNIHKTTQYHIPEGFIVTEMRTSDLTQKEFTS